MIRRVAALLLAGAIVAGCSTNDSGSKEPATTVRPTATTAPSTAAALCAGRPPRRIGALADPALVEASGVVQSRTYPGVLWLHNDSGDTARVFAVTRAGATIRQYALAGADAVDWEDIAIASSPNDAPDTLYLGDIGDNGESRDHIVVYTIREPDPAHDTRASIPADAFTFTYPDGPHNAEAMFVDPRTRELFIVTKSVSGHSIVFRTKNADLAHSSTLVRVRSIDLGLAELVTGGDISADGAAVALRTYTSVFVWARRDGESVDQAFARKPCEAPSANEHQSEAIGIDPDNRGFITTSEGEHAPIWHVSSN